VDVHISVDIHILTIPDIYGYILKSNFYCTLFIDNTQGEGNLLNTKTTSSKLEEVVTVGVLLLN
jgi:hypothetical protein